MKLGTCRYENTSYIFIDTGTHLVLPALGSSHIGENWQTFVDQPAWQDSLLLVEKFDALKTDLETIVNAGDARTIVDYEHVEIIAPIPHPRKNVMCLGLNYLEHAEETAEHVGRSAKKPAYPIIFTKATSSVTTHEATIPYDPETCSQLDWEAELGVIIGKGGRKISRANAMQHVFGYTVINDLSARDLQFNHKQFFMGKSFDGACPIGPYIVTADEIADPHKLNVQCRVNGVVKQDSNTHHMIFDIPAIIETLSKSMTLEPGDIIATGTPSGVGFVREPPEFLQPGDVVECEVEGIGILRNTIG